MYKIVRCIDEDTAVTSTEGYAGENGRNPVNVRCACPRKDHFSDRAAQGSNADDAYHGLWRRLSRRRVRLVRVDQTAEKRLCANGCYAAQADTEISQTREARAPTAEFAENDWVRHKTEVEDSVY